jgi:methionyl-tRNA synthetase
MIQVNVKCPHCGKSLMDDQIKIDDHPSVKLNIQWGGERGRLRLSSLYGSYNIDSQLPVPEGEVAKFFCPQCNAELTSSRTCEQCNAAMVSMKFVEGGAVEICSRRGCRKHLIEFEDLQSELRAFYEKYSLFFRGQ